MYEKVFHRTKAVFSRCLKQFKKQESHEVKEYGNCFCHLQRKTLLTGFSKSDNSKRCRRMTIKPFVFFLCASGFCYQTWSFLQMYLAYPTTLDISEEYPDSFIAPAISICNRNRLLRQPYCKAYPELCTWKHTTWETFCDEHSRMCPETKPPDFNFGIPVFRAPNDQNRSLNYLLALRPQSEYDTLDGCRRFEYEGFMPCVYDYYDIYIPRDGFPYKCLRIVPKKEALHAEQLNMTLTDGLVFDFNMYPEEYFNTIDPVEASIILHDPRKIVNPMTDGITLSAGRFHQVFATMERRESLPPPYASKCMDYSIQWKKNGGFGPLSKDDCIKDCTNSAMVDKYNCVGQSVTYPSGYEICKYINLEATSEMVKKCASGCRDACEEYNYHFTSAVILNMQTRCNLTDEYCKNRYISILLSFNRMKVEIFKQIPRIESIELFSYIGGYLGMWLGISLASAFDLAEMIYGVIDTAFLKRKRIQKTATTIQQFRNEIVIV